jgi:hypothetical protein
MQFSVSRSVLLSVLFALGACQCGTPVDEDAGVPGGDAGPGDDAGPGNDAGPAGPEVTTTTCTNTPTAEPGADVCSVTPGDGNIFIVGDILLPGEIIEGGGILVDRGGTITCSGCECADINDANTATRIICPDAVISPGLINAHDHMGWMHNDPYVLSDPDERYEHRHDWRRGRRDHTEVSPGGGANGSQREWGELRFLLGGATATNASGQSGGLLRNLDGFGGTVPGIDQPVVDYDTFPLGDSNGSLRSDGCDYPNIGSPSDADAYAPHVAEGIDAEARNEFLCLTSTDNGGAEVLGSNTAVVHGVGLLPVDIQKMAAQGMSLIWSPRSNVSLYGDTARATIYDAMGVNIALGTDWMPSGSMNMLRELKCADELNQLHFGGYFSDHALWKMATVGAARSMKMDDAIGVLSPGRTADIAIFARGFREGYRAVLDATPGEVALVLRGGEVIAGNSNVVDALEPGACDPIADVCGRDKRVCLQSEINKSYTQLEGEVGGIYPLFFCDVPEDEPSCLPRRVQEEDSILGSTLYECLTVESDRDGDGIINPNDNCADVFNPIRPLDEGVQADSDLDGLGDACDPCPLQQGTSECSTPDPDDLDSDGVNDGSDNCPGAPNPGQEDGDEDGKGDVCDPCPEDSNPGTAGCPASIYDVKTSDALIGSRVSVADLVVTARDRRGFFVQLDPSSGDFSSEEHSGIYVFVGTDEGLPARWTKLELTGTVGEFFDQRQLSDALWTEAGSVSPLAPRTLTAGERTAAANAGGASPFEGLFVEVTDVSVTDADAPGVPGAGDDDESEPRNEFEIEGGLRVDDAIYLMDPLPSDGEIFGFIRGPLSWRNQKLKLLPRDLDDVGFGAVEVRQLVPVLSYARAGATGPTFPEPLTIELTRAPEEPVTILVSSDATGVADSTAAQIVISPPDSSAVVQVSGVTTGTATFTATRQGSDISATADVRVLGAGENASVASITPASATVATGATLELVVALDLPAQPGGVSVDLATSGGIGSVAPDPLVIAENAQSGVVTLTAAGAEASGLVTATLGGDVSASIEVSELTGGVVINEVDYDQPDTDSAEFIELYNGGANAVDVTGYELLLVNGSGGAIYETITLSGSLPSQGFLVVGSATVNAPGAALTEEFSSASNNVQNGSPDAVVLTDGSAVIDFLSYEGTIDNANLGSYGTLTLTGSSLEDTNGEAGSLSRKVDGADTDDDAADWHFVTTPTPGAANAAP